MVDRRASVAHLPATMTALRPSSSWGILKEPYEGAFRYTKSAPPRSISSRDGLRVLAGPHQIRGRLAPRLARLDRALRRRLGRRIVATREPQGDRVREEQQQDQDHQPRRGAN